MLPPQRLHEPRFASALCSVRRHFARSRSKLVSIKHKIHLTYSTLAIFDYGTIDAKPLANVVSICALHPYGTSGMNQNTPLRKKFREGLKKKQAPSDLLVTSIRMNRQIRVSDGAMFTYRTKPTFRTLKIE